MSMSSSPFIVGLFAAASMSAAALAQEAPAQPPAAPAAPAVEAPQPPTAPTAPAEAAPAAAAPQAEAAAPAEQAAAAPPEPPPTLPTSGDGAVVVNLLTQVCRPLVEGKGQFEQLAKAAGMKKDRRSEAFVLALAQRPYQVEILKPGAANKNVCEMRIRYAPGWDQPIVDAMNVWRFLHDPQLRLKRNDIGAYKDAQRTTTTWDNWENQSYDGKMVGLILVQLNNPDGSAINKNYDEALIQYSQRAAIPMPTPAAPAQTGAAAAPATTTPAG